MSTSSQNLTEKQFDALAKIMRLRTGSDAITACRLVMVDGMTAMQASDATGLDYRLVWRSVARAKDVMDLCRVALNL